jgi:hypothetical protein
MLPALVVLVSPFTVPQPWALGVAATPRIPFAGDVDGDGRAELIVVFPDGDSIIDVIPTLPEGKSGSGYQGLPKWAGKCDAATVGDFDESKGADVAGLFGNEVKIAGGFKDGRFQALSQGATLPKVLGKPALAALGRDILAFSTQSGDAFRIDPRTHAAAPCKVPRNTVWIGQAGDLVVAQDRDGNVFKLDSASFKAGAKLGKGPKASRPAVGRGWVAFGDSVWTPDGIKPLSPANLPVITTIRAAADFDGDGDDDLVEYRYGSEDHTGSDILLRRFASIGETDSDQDGLSNEQEAKLGTDPMNPDTDGDGLLDGWEVTGIRGLDLPKIGCDPRHVDLVCLVSKFAGVAKAPFDNDMARVEKFYKELPTKNPDGTTGMAFHKVDLDTPSAEAEKSGWPENRARFRPEKWRGIVHWMQVTPGGGGQADQLGDGGSCGLSALWAVFTHEFGHQLGLSHEGFWPNGSCPIYSSMMNYNYSYGFENDGSKIHYSDGRFAGYTLREDDLDETIPLPYDKVKFLSMGPYNYRLKPGPTPESTLIDWNWNGVFGEKHIRADINYAYSTNAGARDEVGKTSVAPWLFVHRNVAYVLSGVTATARVAGGDSTLTPARPGNVVIRRLLSPTKWEAPVIVSEGLTGDPVAIGVGSKIVVAYPTARGVAVRRYDPGSKVSGAEEMVAEKAGLVPTVGETKGQPVLMVWDPADGVITAWKLTEKGLGEKIPLEVKSVNPPSMCTDTKTGETILALAQNQDAARPNRWQIRRFDKNWKETSLDWVDGLAGQSRGTGRVTVLFDASRDAGPKGRVLLYGKGMTDAKTQWACTYVAMTIADKTVRGGWLLKRYYDEWTQSRSAPAAAWYKGDVIWAYRWVGGDGPTDDNLHVGYRGLGIQSESFGDFDDIGFIRSFGLQHSLLTLGSN